VEEPETHQFCFCINSINVGGVDRMGATPQSLAISSFHGRTAPHVVSTILVSWNGDAAVTIAQGWRPI
jgi:hypothetical protein